MNWRPIEELPNEWPASSQGLVVHGCLPGIWTQMEVL